MKKSLVTVVTFALVLINLILTVLLAVVVIPETKAANDLISKVAAAIDLDVSGADSSADGGKSSLENVQVYNIADTLTVNLKPSEDGSEHYAQLGVVLKLNKDSKNYKKYGSSFDDYVGLAKNEINKVVSSHTMEEMQNDTEGIQQEIVDAMKADFGNDLVVGVGFSTETFQ